MHRRQFLSATPSLVLIPASRAGQPVIGPSNPNAKAAISHSFATVAACLADTMLCYSEGIGRVQIRAGEIVEAQGFHYQVAASVAGDQHITTAGGVKLYVVPGDAGFNVLAFGAAGDYSNLTGVGTDDTGPIRAAFKAAMTVGLPVHLPGRQYRITDTLCMPNADYKFSFKVVGDSGNSTRIWFDNAVPKKNMFYSDLNISYVNFEDIELLDRTPGTSRAIQFVGTLSGGPAWKHLFKGVRIVGFQEGARFDGGATIFTDAYQSEVMFLHSKFKNCRKSLIYNNIQAVNHQLIGLDIENDDVADASEKWPMIVFERGSFINHLGGSVIGYGPYVSFTYPGVGGAFQVTAQFASRGIRMEARGDGPFIDHHTASDISVSNAFRLRFEDMAVIASRSASPILARFGGRVYARFDNVHSNVPMDVHAYMTADLGRHSENGKIDLNGCRRLNYKRVSDQAAYCSAAVRASDRRAIPAEISMEEEGPAGTVVDGYYQLIADRKTIYSGNWQVAELKTLTWAPSDVNGFGGGSNPATMQIFLPQYARPCKFRLLCDDINAAADIVLDLYFVLAGKDVLVASLAPRDGGHFEANIRGPSKTLVIWIADGLDWDGKMKVVKSGSSDSFVGLIMIDYM
ncbi:MAG: hypothetical protein EOS22_15695 [Mesorhizobium sp.]|uniref:hypothetical protein n=1 Tax=Mesorhizobium sp. TaxID=1871066 RepID=UPI000FE92876|nr:hypothetical protein [Mesorhizobium sp.]RWD26603.1 MAG: hypothetical protein EOS22_15695 [Mesorhizobium sp.]